MDCACVGILITLRMLKSWVFGQVAYPWEFLETWMLQAVSCLADMQDQGLGHNDIKTVSPVALPRLHLLQPQSWDT